MGDDIKIKKSGEAWSFVIKEKLGGEKEKLIKGPKKKDEEDNSEEFVSFSVPNREPPPPGSKGIVYRTKEEVIADRDRREREARAKLQKDYEDYKNRPEFRSHFRAVNSLVIPSIVMFEKIAPGRFGNGNAGEAILTVDKGIFSVEIHGKLIEIPMKELNKLLGNIGIVKGKLDQFKELTNADGKEIIKGTEDALFGKDSHGKQ